MYTHTHTRWKPNWILMRQPHFQKELFLHRDASPHQMEVDSSLIFQVIGHTTCTDSRTKGFPMFTFRSTMTEAKNNYLAWLSQPCICLNSLYFSKGTANQLIPLPSALQIKAGNLCCCLVWKGLKLSLLLRVCVPSVHLNGSSLPKP